MSFDKISQGPELPRPAPGVASASFLPVHDYIPRSVADASQVPQRLLSRYTQFVRSNSFQVAQLESSLRSLTYIIPSRFQETPITAEACHTALTLLTAFHTHLLAPSIGDEGYRASPRARYDQWATLQNSMYRRAVGLLRTIQYTQLLIEMLARKAGDKMRWRVIVFLELVKACCRFAMMYMTRGRWSIGTEVGGEVQERGIDAPGSDDPLLGDNAAMNGVSDRKMNDEPSDQFKASFAATGEWMMPRTGRALPTLPTATNTTSTAPSISSFLDARALTPDDARPAPSLVHRLKSAKALAAESFWVLRPLIYALVLQHYHTRHAPNAGTGPSSAAARRDWRPWLIGLSLELLSQRLAKQDLQSNPGGLRGLSTVDRDELKHRDGSLAWWAMRGAFYNHLTGPVVRKFGDSMKRIPLVGEMVGTVVDDYDRLWRDWYFSTATM